MSITIVEVGPRDGLQNESQPLSIDTRVELIKKLQASGLQKIEAGAFVSPKWVPQMAGTDKVMQALQTSRNPSSTTIFSALTPNLQGFQAAMAAKVQEVAVFTAASESFTQKNIKASIAASIERFKPLCDQAKALGIPVRGYISCVVHCPYEGFIQPHAVVQVIEQLQELGCYQLSLGETTGRATAKHIRALLDAATKNIPASQLAGHFHDTFGQGLANVLASLEFELTTFDASVAGLGGCPYSPGASGNLATEDLVYLLEGLGLNTGIDLQALAETGQWISTVLNKPNGSKAGTALSSPKP